MQSKRSYSGLTVEGYNTRGLGTEVTNSQRLTVFLLMLSCIGANTGGVYVDGKRVMRVPHNIKESTHMGRRRAKEPKSVQVCLRLTPQQYAILRAYTQIKGYQQVGDSLRWVIDGMERWCRDKAPSNKYLETLDKIRVQNRIS